ncbi:MAG: SMC-Scp complex subunit ScpB [Halobacteriota archaeon]|nr:SMC-Scp complex subunit ScpB [Halobacteriota archaeon]
MDDIRIVEAVLFTSERALSPGQLGKILSKPAKHVKGLISELMNEYEDRAIEIVNIDGKYVMQVKTEFAKYLKGLAPREMDTQVLRTLSVIAYHQPVTQSDVVAIRGNKTYEHIKELEGMKLISSKPKGHSKLLTTTDRFVEYFWNEEDDKYSDTEG